MYAVCYIHLVPPTRITAYRRHVGDCPDKDKGQHFTLCKCPIWAYGGAGFRRSLKTTNWERALQRIEILTAGGAIDDGPGGMRLTAAIERYTADLASRNLAASTLKLYEILFGHLQKFCGDDVSLSALDADTLDRFRQSRVRILKDKTTRAVESGTQRKELGFLRAFFRWCQDRKWIDDNPAKRVRMPKETAIGTLPFEPGEVRKLIDACGQVFSDNPADTAYVRHRARALVYVLLYSGLRISDVAKLRRDALDAATGHLTIRRIQKTNVPLKVRLQPAAAQSLSTLPATNPEYFFWSGAGRLVTLRKNLSRSILRLGKLAGVKATPHRFRDTFAVELLTNGADIRTVQMLLGHESVRTTEKHYARFVAAHQHLLDSATATLDFEREPGRPLLMHKLGNRRRDAK